MRLDCGRGWTGCHESGQIRLEQRPLEGCGMNLGASVVTQMPRTPIASSMSVTF